MTPLILGLGTTELLIILAVVLLLFGGTRLAGLGRSSGRAIREFKEETKGLKDEPNAHPDAPQDPRSVGTGNPGGTMPANNPPMTTNPGAPAANPGVSDPGVANPGGVSGQPSNPAPAPDRHPDDLR